MDKNNLIFMIIFHIKCKMKNNQVFIQFCNTDCIFYDILIESLILNRYVFMGLRFPKEIFNTKYGNKSRYNFISSS